MIALVFEIVSDARRRAEEDGLHDPPPRAAVEFHILCVGDSHTAGSGAPSGRGYPEQLQELLDARAPGRYGVVNIGRAGFNSSQSLHRTRRYIERYPRAADLIVFCAGFNNAWNFAKASVLPEEIRDAPLKVQFRHLLAESAVYRFGQITKSRFKQFLKTASSYGDVRTTVLESGEPAELEFLTTWLERDLENLITLADAQGARVALLTYWNWSEASPQMNAYYAEAVRRRALMIDVANFGFPRSESRQARHFVQPDQHPNEAGYARIARSIFNALVERSLVPGESVPLDGVIHP
ncbi:MAG: SGNH/GDSL hydrolase family protein [Deltaproteobacteria bacterium]|nr:SGNH/GDSL hydrolase family protein [Deltaproteobacteria bacterium]